MPVTQIAAAPHTVAGHTPKVGGFVLVAGYSHRLLGRDIYEVTKVTTKLVVCRAAYGSRQFRIEELLASFDSKPEAEQLRDTLGGIKGEMERRIKAAQDSAAQAARAAIAKATAARQSGEDA